MNLPDYSTQRFASARQSLVQVFGMSEQEAVDQLASIWRQRNPGTAAPVPHQTSSQSQALVLATDILSAPERKRSFPKFIQGRCPPTRRDPYPFEHAICKLKNFEYVALWYFTPKGCEIAAAHAFSIEEADTTVIRTGSSLVPISTRAFAALEAAFVPDKDLTYDEMSIAQMTLVSYMAKCDWPPNLINMFMHFHQCLITHPLGSEPGGDQVLVKYQAEARLEWHRTLAISKDNQTFDLSVINNHRLEEIEREIRRSIQLKLLSVSISPDNEIPTNNTFSLYSNSSTRVLIHLLQHPWPDPHSGTYGSRSNLTWA
jgi:hypothetical protein